VKELGITNRKENVVDSPLIMAKIAGNGRNKLTGRCIKITKFRERKPLG
jgi:hypothetical protein